MRSDLAALILRLGLAVVMFPHGAQKALGWFGGGLTRLAALGIAIDMTVAAILVHARNGFFMNFSGRQAGEGVEFFILMVTIALALAIGGPGRYALLRRT